MLDMPRLKLTKYESAIKKAALKYPATSEHMPWGHHAIKVKNKIFLTLTAEKEVTTLSFKLPVSGKAVLKNAFAAPTHYGMGKHGWVTVTFPAKSKLPMPEILAWMDESYRAIAPKTLVKEMDAHES